MKKCINKASLLLACITTCFSMKVHSFKLSETGQGTISYERFVRLNQPEQGEKRNIFDWLESSYQYNLTRGPIEGRFDGDFRFFINTKQFNLSLSEAYFRYKGVDGSEHTLGRQRLDWHTNEHFWQLSHLQGLRNFRLLDRKQEGLLGYHLKTNYGTFKGEYFLSYFYVPTMNPSIEVVDGKVRSNSDWYRKPPTQAIVADNGGQSDILYSINDPNYKDIFIQKTLGGRLSLDWDLRDKSAKSRSRKQSSGTFGKGKISGFSIYKPESTIRVNAAATPTNQLDVNVTASPVVNHHLIYGTTVEQEIGQSKNIFGLTFVDPTARLGKDFDALSIDTSTQEENERSGVLIDPKYDRETYLHFSTHLPGNIVSATFNGIHYLTNHDKGNDDFYSDTVRWLSAVGANFTYYATESITASANFRYDFKRKDNLLDGNIRYVPFQNAFINVGIELIRSPDTSSYWSSYRANDTGYINFGMIL